MKDDRTAVQRADNMVQGDLYEDLLNRYERVLVFAGQLQEKTRQQKLLADQNQSLEGEVDRLNRMVDVERSYVRLLEGALTSLGVLKADTAVSEPGPTEAVPLQDLDVADIRTEEAPPGDEQDPTEDDAVRADARRLDLGEVGHYYVR